jgi:hypothetical protein
MQTHKHLKKLLITSAFALLTPRGSTVVRSERCFVGSAFTFERGSKLEEIGAEAAPKLIIR